MAKRKKAAAIIKRTVKGDTEYGTVKQAAASIQGADPQVIERVLRGSLPTAYGCRWMYKEV